MLRKRFIRFAAFIMCAVCLLMSACTEDDGKGYVFGYNISTNPASLDPQYASDKDSYLVIGCIFEGLFRADAQGGLNLACAESYEVSDDGLTYTFKLRQDRYWTDVNGYEAQVTAQDFVFGFRRLFNPETRAPKAADYYCIKNSKDINQGITKDFSKLGVTATGKFELKIELDYPSPSFLMLLSMPAAMPCNEEYFTAAQGKYGLDAERTPSNGAFYVKSWYYDPWSDDNNNLVLRYSEKYNESEEVTPLGLNFFITDKSQFLTDFESGTSQSILLSGDTGRDYVNDEYDVLQYSTAVYGIAANTKSSVFKSDMLRLAMLYASDTSEMAMPFGFENAYGAVPSGVAGKEGSYRQYAGSKPAVKPDEVKAYSCYRKAAESIDSADLNSVTILAVENRDEEIAAAMHTVIQQWQAKLGFYCGIAYVSESEYNEKLASGDYSLALVRFSGEYNSPASYLEYFTKSKYNAMGAEYKELLSNAASAKTEKEAFEYCKQAEKLLLCDGRFIPLAYASEYFISDKNCDNISFNPFTGMIDYRKALYFD